MLSLNKKTSFNYLLGITLTSAIITLNGCGGDSAKSAPDTSGIVEAKLKQSLKDGLTKGLSSNMDSLGSSLSTVNNNLNNSSPANSSPKLIAGVGASDPIVDSLNEAKNNIVEKFNLLIDNSTSTSNANVYTFDPDENTICVDTSLQLTASEITKCKTVLQNITFVSTVNAIDSNNNITAADTDFKYNTSIFSKLGFTNNSSYYQVEFGGLPDLLVGINSVANPNDQIDIPNSMAGSLRVASNAQTTTSGTFTISVPTTIAITDTPVTNINIGQTNSLFSVSADSVANSLNVSINMSALDILTTQTDDQNNTFTEQVILNAITGNATVTNNGNTVTLTGVGANSVQFKIDGALALNASLASLGATISKSNNQTLLTLANALDFNLSMTNLRGYMDNSQPTTDTLSVNINATTGTVVRKSTTNNGPKLLKVTNGSLVVNKTTTGSTVTAVNSTVISGSCLNTGDLSVDTSANCQ